MEKCALNVKFSSPYEELLYIFLANFLSLPLRRMLVFVPLRGITLYICVKSVVNGELGFNSFRPLTRNYSIYARGFTQTNAIIKQVFVPLRGITLYICYSSFTIG